MRLLLSILATDGKRGLVVAYFGFFLDLVASADVVLVGWKAVDPADVAVVGTSEQKGRVVDSTNHGSRG